MPMYEFSCTKCSNISEKLVPMDTKHITCGKCGSESVKIVSLTGSPQFHGTGFTPRFHPNMGSPTRDKIKR